MKQCPECGGTVVPPDWTQTDATDAPTVTEVDGDDTQPMTLAMGSSEHRVCRLADGTPVTAIGVTARDSDTVVVRRFGDRYRVENRIGAGGFGAVYDGYDERLGKRVAIKVLAPELVEDKEMLTRFKREAVAASQVRHECVVDVTDFDVDRDGTHFMVMELLDGQDLSQILDGHPMAPERALIIAEQCASGLSATHAAGILHRDLKPGNVFLVNSPMREDFVKIIDFGISKFVDYSGLGFSPDSPQFADITDGAEVVGTPYYISPEHLQGQNIDGRSDLYALGVILYEMLTGMRPFSGASVFEIMTNHVEQARRPPSAVHPLLRLIAGLDEMLLRALAPDPDHRYASMEQFGEQISRCLTSVRANRFLLREVSELTPTTTPRS